MRDNCVANAHQAAVSEALAEAFFDVVPENYETYCSLASRIVMDVFRQFSIPANLVPCQLWHLSANTNHVLGFIGSDASRRWDGHVVCMTETLLIDAALRSFHRDFSFAVPRIAVATRMTTPSHVLARHKLQDGCRLWWMNPPYGFDPTPPLEPADVVADYAGQIVARMQRRMGTPRSHRFSLTAPRHGSGQRLQVDGTATSS
jgi:hypothetical protein